MTEPHDLDLRVRDVVRRLFVFDGVVVDPTLVDLVLRTADVVEGEWSREPPPHDHVNVRFVESWRWLPYKKNSSQFQRGIKGRWQRATEHGWDNARLDPGVEWKLNPDLSTR